MYVRTGVCRDCPEGVDWQHIPCQDMGVINIACGPTGLVWAITWDGHAMVRTHVSRDAVYGEGFKKAETVNSHCDAMVTMIAGIAQWLERRTRD